MSKADLKCYGCGAAGHFESECRNAAIDTAGKPPGCGICDERTRQVNLGDTAGRCTVCHPLARKQLKQHRKCPRCHATVHEWDNGDCGSHSGPTAPDRRPERKHIEQIVGAP